MIVVQAMVGLTLLVAWRSRGSVATPRSSKPDTGGHRAFLGAKARTRATLELP
jgi:hypothetical protein